MKNYPNLDNINSEVAEQMHARLKPLGASLCYMDLEGFINILRIYMWYYNMIHKSKIGLPSDYPFKDIFESMSAL